MYLRLSPYQDILQGVLTDLEVNEGIIKIIGKSGAGKTALCSQLYQELESKGQHAIFFLSAPASATALQNKILASLKIDTSSNFTKALTAYLLAKAAERKPLVLIFDDAQNLDQQTFGAIRMLCNIQDGTHALIRSILCGNEELDRKLGTPALRAVTQFLSQSFTLPYLTRDQVNDFCQGYWMHAAHDMKPLQEKALQKLYLETQGRPGLLQARLNQGTTGAEKLERTRSESGAATASRPRKYAGERPGWVPAMLIVGALLVVTSGGAYLFMVQPSGAGPRETTAVAEPPATLPAPQPDAAVAAAPVVDAAPPQQEPVAVTADALAAAPDAAAITTADGATDDAASVLPEQTANADLVTSDVGTSADEATEAAAQGAETVSPDVEARAAVAAPEPQDVAEATQMPEPGEFIAEWARNWQNRDVEAYLAQYDARFVPPQGLTQAAWQEQRRSVITNAGDIAITFEAPLFSAEAQDGMRIIRFWLYYSAENYADRTLKELLLVPVDGNWRIRAENNLQTERD